MATTPIPTPQVTEPTPGANPLADAFRSALIPALAPVEPTPQPSPTAVPPPSSTDAGGAATPPTPAPEEPTAEPDELEIDFDAPEGEAKPADAASEPDKPPVVSDAEKAALAESLSGDEQKLLDKIVASHGKGAHALESVLLRTSRGKRMLSAFKAIGELEKPASEGGLGHQPSVEDIKNYHQSHANWQAMQHEYTANPVSWIANMFGPDEEGKVPAGAVEIVRQLPAVLSASAPELFSALISPIVQRRDAMVVKDLRDTAMKIPKGQNLDSKTGLDDRQRAQDAAQIVEFRLTGRTTPFPDGEATLPAGGPDPFAAERQRLESERQQYEQRNRSMLQAQQEQFDSTVADSIKNAVAQDVSKALAPLNSSLTPLLFNQLKENLENTVYQHVTGNGVAAPMNPGGFQSFQIQVEQARRGFLSTGKLDPKALADAYRQMARQVIRRLAPQYLRDAVPQAKQASEARHQQLAAAAQHVAPPGGGSPVPQSVVPAPAPRQPGETEQEHFARQLHEAISLAGR